MFDGSIQSPLISNSLRPHGLQCARPPCPSPSPEVCPSSCPLLWWCHPAIPSSDALFSFCPQSFLASGTFPVSQLLASDDHNTGLVASALVPSTSTQSWSPSRLTGLISLLSKGLSKSSPAPRSKASVLCYSAFFTVQLSQPYVTTGKTIVLTIRTLVCRVMSLLFNILSRFVIAFLLRSRCLLISWLQSPSAVILEPRKRKSVTTPFPLLFAMK